MLTRNWAGQRKCTRRWTFSTFICVPAKRTTGIRTTSITWIILSVLAAYFRLFMFMQISAGQGFLGVTHVPKEGGVMMVRSRDDIYRMADLKGKKIGLSRSQNKIKTDWWGIQEEQGIELMLRMNGMTRADVQIVEFPYAG